MGRKKQLNKHHIRAKERGGKDENNIVELDQDWHSGWHFLFFNADPEEVIQAIRIIMQPGTRWTYAQIRNLLETLRKP